MRNRISQYRARELRQNATDAEQHIWRYLRRRQLEGVRFRRQVPIGQYIADFACLEIKLIVELDGGQHQEQGQYNDRRARYLEARGFRILRFWDNDVFNNTSAVLEVIFEAVTSTNRPLPCPPPHAGEGAE